MNLPYRVTRRDKRGEALEAGAFRKEGWARQYAAELALKWPNDNTYLTNPDGSSELVKVEVKWSSVLVVSKQEA